MPTWDEICQVLEELRMLILEIQIELADPATVQDRRPGLQELLTACEVTWEEIMDKYGNSHLQAFLGRQLPSRECN